MTSFWFAATVSRKHQIIVAEFTFFENSWEPEDILYTLEHKPDYPTLVRDSKTIDVWMQLDDDIEDPSFAVISDIPCMHWLEFEIDAIGVDEAIIHPLAGIDYKQSCLDAAIMLGVTYLQPFLVRLTYNYRGGGYPDYEPDWWVEAELLWIKPMPQHEILKNWEALTDGYCGKIEPKRVWGKDVFDEEVRREVMMNDFGKGIWSTDVPARAE